MMYRCKAEFDEVDMDLSTKHGRPRLHLYTCGFCLRKAPKIDEILIRKLTPFPDVATPRFRHVQAHMSLKVQLLSPLSYSLSTLFLFTRRVTEGRKKAAIVPLILLLMFWPDCCACIAKSITQPWWLWSRVI